MSIYRHNRNVMKNYKEVGGSSISLIYVAESVNPLKHESLATQISFDIINKINGAFSAWIRVNCVAKNNVTSQKLITHHKGSKPTK